MKGKNPQMIQLVNAETKCCILSIQMKHFDSFSLHYTYIYKQTNKRQRDGSAGKDIIDEAGELSLSPGTGWRQELDSRELSSDLCGMCTPPPSH